MRCERLAPRDDNQFPSWTLMWSLWSRRWLVMPRKSLDLQVSVGRRRFATLVDCCKTNLCVKTLGFGSMNRGRIHDSLNVATFCLKLRNNEQNSFLFGRYGFELNNMPGVASIREENIEENISVRGMTTDSICKQSSLHRLKIIDFDLCLFKFSSCWVNVRDSLPDKRVESLSGIDSLSNFLGNSRPTQKIFLSFCQTTTGIKEDIRKGRQKLSSRYWVEDKRRRKWKTKQSLL